MTIFRRSHPAGMIPEGNLASLSGPAQRWESPSPPAPTSGPGGAWLEQAVHRMLIVHTKSDKSYRGLLRDRFTDGLLFWNPELLADKGDPVRIAGDLFIPDAEIHIIQTDTQ